MPLAVLSILFRGSPREIVAMRVVLVAVEMPYLVFWGRSRWQVFRSDKTMDRYLGALSIDSQPNTGIPITVRVLPHFAAAISTPVVGNREHAAFARHFIPRVSLRMLCLSHCYSPVVAERHSTRSDFLTRGREAVRCAIRCGNPWPRSRDGGRMP